MVEHNPVGLALLSRKLYPVIAPEIFVAGYNFHGTILVRLVIDDVGAAAGGGEIVSRRAFMAFQGHGYGGIQRNGVHVKHFDMEFGADAINTLVGGGNGGFTRRFQSDEAAVAVDIFVFHNFNGIGVTACPADLSAGRVSGGEGQRQEDLISHIAGNLTVVQGLDTGGFRQRFQMEGCLVGFVGIGTELDAVGLAFLCVKLAEAAAAHAEVLTLLVADFDPGTVAVILPDDVTAVSRRGELVHHRLPAIHGQALGAVQIPNVGFPDGEGALTADIPGGCLDGDITSVLRRNDAFCAIGFNVRIACDDLPLDVIQRGVGGFAVSVQVYVFTHKALFGIAADADAGGRNVLPQEGIDGDLVVVAVDDIHRVVPALLEGAVQKVVAITDGTVFHQIDDLENDPFIGIRPHGVITAGRGGEAVGLHPVSLDDALTVGKGGGLGPDLEGDGSGNVGGLVILVQYGGGQGVGALLDGLDLEVAGTKFQKVQSCIVSPLNVGICVVEGIKNQVALENVIDIALQRLQPGEGDTGYRTRLAQMEGDVVIITAVGVELNEVGLALFRIEVDASAPVLIHLVAAGGADLHSGPVVALVPDDILAGFRRGELVDLALTSGKGHVLVFAQFPGAGL